MIFKALGSIKIKEERAKERALWSPPFRGTEEDAEPTKENQMLRKGENQEKAVAWSLRKQGA